MECCAALSRSTEQPNGTFSGWPVIGCGVTNLMEEMGEEQAVAVGEVLNQHLQDGAESSDAAFKPSHQVHPHHAPYYVHVRMLIFAGQLWARALRPDSLVLVGLLVGPQASI